MTPAPTDTTIDCTVIALHGNGGGAHRYARTAPHFDAGVALEALTLPGFAREPRDPAIRDLSGFAEHVAQAIASIPRPRMLLGHGIGGSIALEFVQRHAAEIDALILHAPVGARLDQRRFPALMRIPGARGTARRLLASRVFRPIWRRLFFDETVPRDYLDRFFSEYGSCTAFADMFDWITAPWFNGLEPVNTRTALVWGEREKILSPDHIADYTRLVPNHFVRRIPEWDHFPMIDRPEDYARVISDVARELLR